MILWPVLLINLSYSMVCENRSNDPYFEELKSHMEKNCAPRNVHLSFDDGPRAGVTNKILDELKKRKIKGTFFVSTTNIDPKHPKYKEHQELLKREIQEGHAVADHGYEHTAYDVRFVTDKKSEYESLSREIDHNSENYESIKKTGHFEKSFNEKEREEQIGKSVDLLNQATNGQFEKQDFKLFRFPYGRGAMPSPFEILHMKKTGVGIIGDTDQERKKSYQNVSGPLQSIGQFSFEHLGWNHDSNDSAQASFKNESEFKKFVLSNVDSFCSHQKNPKTLVALFHDIKDFNPRAIGLITDLSECNGINFISTKEMMKERMSLIQEGVLIAPKTLKDPLGDLINNLKTPGPKVKPPHCVGCEDKAKVIPPKGCESSYLHKTVEHCSGGDFICFDGEWKKKDDPVVLLNCRLQ